MKNIFTPHRYLISSLIILSLLFISILFWPKESTHSQLPPSPPPVPVPLVPSVLEDIRNTKHNLSFIEPVLPGGEKRAVFTTQTTEICVFCHTPHGAIGDEEAAGLNAPLWNRRLSTARYVLYDQVWSTSFEAYETKPKPNAPTGYSRLCLSCHDGTIALGTVINPPGSGMGIYDPSLGMLMTYPTGQAPAGKYGTMPVGSGVTTGDTRVIGTNLQNDHPISFVYDSPLAVRDEELVDPGPALFGPTAKVSDTTPISPLRRYPGADLNSFDSLQCTSCHNPHAVTFPKFLRANYYNEEANPSTGKIICLYCHDKPGWSGSSHDKAQFKPYEGVGHPTSTKYNFDGAHTVGQYACRACHDPHTAQGAKRLLREGVDINGNTAIENTCFLCHRPASEMGSSSDPPPDIRSEFYKDANLGKGGAGSAMNLAMGQGHEPVFVSRAQEGVELYSNNPPPFNEYTPGSTIQDTVHIECVDCHNPHQVTKTNRLKGMKGIDINGNIVGAKIPGNSREPFVHEVCLRCHGNSYTNLFIGNRYPDPEDVVTNKDGVTYSPRSNPQVWGLASINDFSMKGYSNKRKEFDPATPDIATGHTQRLANPAFHPVAAPGRNGTSQLCNQLAVAFNLDCGAGPGVVILNVNSLNPTRAAEALKNITITCTDCHNNNAFGVAVKGPVTGLPDGSSYRRVTDVRPPDTSPYFTTSMSNEPTTPQGPHGSDNIRILRDVYKTDIEDPVRCFGNDNPKGMGCSKSDGWNSSHFNNFRLCFACHDERAFNMNKGKSVTSSEEITWTNFIGVKSSSISSYWDGNLHKYHLKYTGAYCHECHYNVHSNIESANTIYGDGNGGELWSDSADGILDDIIGTHLVNFAPGRVAGKSYGKPKLYYTQNRIYCNLSCHNVDMSTCFYGAQPGATRCRAGSCIFF
ncbi:MAG: hypothetical protein HZA12_05840 [Nitrospirae bacterium]|nr:hypothetical protein [Nitrospirota bacterium]